MNDDLIIDIGADLSSFTSTLKKAETSFKAYRKRIEALGKSTQLVQSTADFVKQLQMNEAKYKAFSNKIKKLNKKATDAQIKEAFEYYKTIKSLEKKAISEQEAATKVVTNKKKALMRELYDLGIKYEKNLSVAQLKAVKRKALAERKMLTEAYSYEERRQEVLYKRKLRQIKSQETAYKKMVDTAYAYEARRQEVLYRRKLANIRRAERAAATPSDGTATWDFAGHRGLIDSTKVVAKYGAISQALYGMQSAYRAVGAEIIRFDQSIYNNMAVLGANREQATALAKTTTALSQAYGGDVADMADALLTLGRAGFEIDKGIGPLQEATKVLAELAMITGDTMADGAAGIATLVSVYPELTDEVSKLGNQLAIVANATRLGLKDFTTISNYALTTAASIGLNAEAYLALGGAMSKVGLNASTIGTSIRRLKKFTDSTASSMKTFFRYLGITQEEFRGLLQSEKTSTAALIAFSRQLNKVSKDKKKYTEMTKDLNIQEKATIDALRLIGKSDYLTKMILELRGATKESKQLEEQAKRMSQGLTKAFERIGNMIAQTFNDLGDTVSNLLFDTSSTEAFAESLNAFAKIVVFLIKQIPILIGGWVIYAVKMTIVSSATYVTAGATGVLTGALNRMALALKDISKGTWFIVAITAAFTLWNMVSSASLEIQEDLNKLIEDGYEGLQKYSKARLDVANRTSKKVIEASEAEIESVKKTLAIQKMALATSGESDWFGLVNRKENVENLTLKLEELEKKLVRQIELGKEINDVQTNFSDTPLPYVPSPEEMGMLEQIAALNKANNIAATEKLLSYKQLQATVIKTSTALEKQQAIENTQKATTQALLADSKARFSIRKAELKIAQDFLSSEIGLNKARATYTSLLKGEQSFSIKRLALSEQHILLKQQESNLAGEVNAMLLIQGNEYKKTVEYQIQITEKNKINAEIYKNQTEQLKLTNDELIKVSTNIDAATNRARSLLGIFTSFTNSLSASARAMGVLMGTMTPEAASVANAQDVLTTATSLFEFEQKALTIQQDKIALMKTQQASVDDIKKAEEAKFQIQGKIASARAAEAQAQVGLATANVAEGKALVTQSNLEAENAVRILNANTAILPKKERAVQAEQNKLKALKAQLIAAKAMADVDRVGGSAANLVDDIGIKILERKKVLAEKVYDLEHPATSTGAANKRAELKLTSDLITMLQKKAELQIAEQERDFARMSIVLNEYAMNELNAVRAWDAYNLEAAAYDLAVLKAGALANEATVAKKLLDLKIKMTKAEEKAWKAQNKNAVTFEKKMAKIGDGFADSLLDGDIGGAFKDLFKDIYKVFTKPLKDSFSELFGKQMEDMVGGFYDSLTGFIQTWASEGILAAMGVAQANAVAGVAGQAEGEPYTAWARMAAMAATMAAMGLVVGGIGGGSAVSDEEIEAATGRTEYDDESISNLNDLFEDSLYPLLEVNYKMSKYLRNMDNNFYAIARAFSTQASSGGIDLTGVNFAETYSEGFLGFSSESISLIGTGLLFQVETLQTAMDAATLSVRAYTTTLVEESSWFGLSNSSAIEEAYEKLPNSIKEDMADSFANGYEAILTAAVGLGFDESYIANALLAAEVKLGKIDFTGLSPDEVNERLSQAFSTALSGVVEQIPELTQLVDRYVQGTDEALETLGRLALEFTTASHSFSLIGKELTDAGVTQYLREWTETTTEIINTPLGFMDLFVTSTRRVTTAYSEWIETTYTAQMKMLDIVEASGGLDNFNDNMEAFMGGFFTEDEQWDMLQKSLSIQFDTLADASAQLNGSLPTTNAGFRDLLENFEVLNEQDAETYAGLLSLSSGFSELIPLIDDASDALSSLLDAWTGDLSYLTDLQKTEYTAGFAELARENPEDLNSVDVARAAAEAALLTTATKEEYIPTFNRYIDALEEEVADSTNTDIIDKLDELIKEVIISKETTVDAYIYGA